MTSFSVLLLTAAPPGMAGEAGGAYVKIDGREALLRSAELFLNRENVKQIQVVILPDMLEEAKRKYAPHFSFSGIKMIGGGPRWIDQIAAAAGKVSPDASHVIVHDAARPAVPAGDIDALMEAAESHPAIVLTAPLRAPLIEVDEAANPVAAHLPARFVQVLAPQCYAKDTLAKMAQSGQDPHASQLRLLKGSPLNIRISGPGDASLIKSMLTLLPKPRVKPPSSPFEEAQW
jgi:2-C-methyl-D-erythritol 4-phosphate cytidylyltransferase